MSTRPTRGRRKDADEAEDRALPPLVDGELATVLDVKVLGKTTKPPKPYTEGTLLDDMRNAGKFLEETQFRAVLKQVNGLGTAATRDATIEGLKHDKYVLAQGKYIKPTEKGIALIQWLETACPILVDVATTASWEAQLDVIAQKGGGVHFETDIARQVTAAVASLKASPRLKLTSTQKESSMSEDNGRAPSVKQLEFAERIAEQLGVSLPEDARTSMSVCSRFIDEHKVQLPNAGVRPPSEPQIQFMQRIASTLGLTVPEQALSDSQAASAFIEQNKDKAFAMGGNRPSDKAISYAESLAKKAGISVPADALNDRTKLSAFIDAHR